MIYINWRYTKGSTFLAFDLYLNATISLFGLFEYFQFKRYRSVLLLITVFLGISQVYRLVGGGDINSILIAWVPPVIVLASFLYGIRYALIFIGLYLLMPLLVFIFNRYDLLPEFLQFAQPPKQSVFASLVGAMLMCFGFSFVFESFRKKIDLAIQRQSKQETEKRFFATLSHEVNNPITIAILALNRDAKEEVDPIRDRIMENLVELSKRSYYYDQLDE